MPFGVFPTADRWVDHQFEFDEAIRHQCLSAFSPLLTRTTTNMMVLHGWCHQCLSAFSPLLTFIYDHIANSGVDMSPMPFGVFPTADCWTSSSLRRRVQEHPKVRGPI